MSIKKRFFEFALWLTVLTLFLLVAYQLVYIVWPQTPVSTYVLYIFLLPYLLNLGIYFLILKGMTLEPQYLIQIIVLSIVVKLLLFGAFNFVMIYLSPDEAIANVVAFFAVYLLSTSLEIAMLVPLINKKESLTENASE